MPISLQHPSLARIAYHRISARESCDVREIELLSWCYHLHSCGQRVLTSDLVRAGLLARTTLYRVVKRAITRGWLVRIVRPDRRGARPSLVVTADGLLVVERIRRELRTCAELLNGAGRGKVRRKYTKKAPKQSV